MSHRQSHSHGDHTSRELVPYATAPGGREVNTDSRKLYLQVSTAERYQAINTWRLFMKVPGSDRGIVMEILGALHHRNLNLANDQAFETPRMKQSIYLGTVNNSESLVVVQEAEMVPPQHPQLWCCYVMRRLERKGILQSGTSDHFKKSFEFGDAYEFQQNDLREHNYAPCLDDYGIGPDSQSRVCPLHGC